MPLKLITTLISSALKENSIFELYSKIQRCALFIISEHFKINGLKVSHKI